MFYYIKTDILYNILSKLCLLHKNKLKMIKYKITYKIIKHNVK